MIRLSRTHSAPAAGTTTCHGNSEQSPSSDFRWLLNVGALEHNITNIITTTEPISNDHISIAINDDPRSTPTRDGRRSGGCTFVMKYLSPTLLILVATKYQLEPDVLFSQSPIQLWTYIAATCLYCAMIEILKNLSPLYQRLVKLFDLIALVCKLVSIISLVTVLLPSRVSLLVFIVSTCLIGTILVLGLIHARYRKELATISAKLCAKLLRTTTQNLEQV